jgi:hypothetical protein
MKKISLLFLATFYFVCAIGVYVHAHFCGGELSSVSYFAVQDADDCGCGDEPKDSNCCKDVKHFFKVANHQNSNLVKAADILDFKHVSVLPSFYIFWNIFSPQVFAVNHSHAPPPYLFAKASKLIVNSVFRI